MDMVIKPKVDGILVNGIGSIGELVSRFNRFYKCKVSRNRMARWLKMLGYRVTRKVEISGPRPAPVVPVEPEVRTSEFERLSDMPAPRVRFNFPNPPSVFENVRMPGSEE